MKSTNISSAAGLIPAVAAPIAAPRNAGAEMGVSRTRPGNLWYSPLVTPSTPPQASSSPGAPMPPAMSSPMITTVSSRAISDAIASATACWYLILRAISVPHVDVGEHVGGRGIRRGVRLVDRLVHQPPRRLVDGGQLVGLD